MRFCFRNRIFKKIDINLVVGDVQESDGFHHFRTRPLCFSLEKSANLAFGTLIGIAGLIMTVITFTLHTEDKGNIIPALSIAVLSAAANSLFWLKYTRLHRAGAGAIMGVQARLYRAKTLIDTGITAVLLTIFVAPMSAFAHWLDFSGSLLVALYLTWCGIKTVYEEIKNK